MDRELKYSEAILEATTLCMEEDPHVISIGLGVPDPKGIFGTTLGLSEKFGAERVLDMPTSENAMTGILIGTAIRGMRPMMTHQRVDFFLLALDQLINNAAKWHYMFDKQMSVPIVFRLIIGRGWGQGPQHSQSLHSLFAHIPGLVVLAPSTPYDAKGLLISAIESNNPVVFLEHRWLHQSFGPVPKEKYTVPIGKAKVMRSGKDVTIVSSSHFTIEALRAHAILQQDGIDAEIVDLRSLKPIDTETIFASVQKTGHLIVLDGDWKTAGFAAEIITLVTENIFPYLKKPPIRITYPDTYVPTSWALSKNYYPTFCEIITVVRDLFGVKKSLKEILEKQMSTPKDVPDHSFTGPF